MNTLAVNCHKVIVFLMIALTACSSLSQNCYKDCDNLIAAEEARYGVCERQVEECTSALKQDHPSLLTKAVYGVIGLAVGLIIGVKLGR